MITLSRILAQDSSLRPLFTGREDLEILGISSVDLPKEETILFIKDIKFYKKALAKITTVKKIYVVMTSALYEKLNESEKSQFSFLLLTTSYATTVSLISKLFFSAKFEVLNTMVDGRQMGSATIHPTAMISQGVFIGEDVTIGSNVTIHSGCTIMGKVTIKDHTVLYPNVVIYPYVTIGNHCRIHANVSLGGDGFGYQFEKGVHHKIWHLGDVIIGNDVEIGCNSTVDRGTFGDTVIGDGCRIDNLVQIAHNCKVGRGVVLCGQTGLAGSCTVGDFSVLAGGAGLADGTVLGRGVQVGGKAGVTGVWEDGAVISGTPARPIKEWLRGVAYLRKISLKNE